MRADLRHEKGFFSLLGLIIAAAVVFFLCSIMLKTYFKNSTLENIGKEAHSTQGTNTPGYAAVVEHSKAAVSALNKQTLEQEKQIEEFNGQGQR